MPSPRTANASADNDTSSQTSGKPSYAHYNKTARFLPVLFIAFLSLLSLAQTFSRILFSPAWLSAQPSSTVTIERDNVTDIPLYIHKHTTAPWTVFYNIFVPPTDQGFDNSIRIIKEQLDQIASSHAVTAKTLAINYVTIGDLVNKQRAHLAIQDLCKQHNSTLTCTRINHVEQAFEEVTLDHVHQHCQVNPDSRVIYIHNKGSFHPYPGNEAWRWHLTAAAVSKECLSNQACNLCGLQFTPVWGSYIAGNMFVAPCDYIRRLVPARDFISNLTSIVTDMCRLQQQGHFMTTMYKQAKGRESRMFLGLERWAMELWPGSHPSVKPCDMSDSISLQPWHTGKHESDFVWQMAPHKSLESDWFAIDRGELSSVLSSESRLRREYFLLAGNLYKWIKLYGEVPPEDSWYWTFFPDGDFWKAAMRQYNLTSLVQEATRPYRDRNSLYKACYDLFNAG
jgi:hypothetical protein